MSDKPFTLPVDPIAADTARVAKRLAELMNANKGHEALIELYAADSRHVEAMAMPGSDNTRITQGKEALIKMSEHWGKITTVHGFSMTAPRVNGDQFTCDMMLDATSSDGPMAGQRIKMEETCVYTVKNGLITEAKFFYSCG